MPTTDNDDKLQHLLASEQMQLELTFAASDTVDTKALALLAANIAFAIYSLQSILQAPFWLVALLFGCLAASTACNVIGSKPRDYIGPGVDLESHPEYYLYANQELLLQLIADTDNAISINSSHNSLKRKWLFRSFMLFGAGILLMVGCILSI